nr:hypothetical protein BCU37_14240 [Vibrio splendidus]PMK53371.1 hypothetical protein BCT96_23000 [Vibrio splendidus]
MELEKIPAIFSLIGAICTLIYYLNRDESKCKFCGKTISHRKVNRYYMTINNKQHAVCKGCSNKKILVSAHHQLSCSCCSKDLSKSNKVHSWQGKKREYHLCTACNAMASKQSRRNFRLDEVLSCDFLQKYTDFHDINHLARKYDGDIEKQDDLNSPNWNQYIINNTHFSSWKEMAEIAQHEMLSLENDDVIKMISKKVSRR